MPKVMLNAKMVEALKPLPDKVLEHFDTKVPGLILRTYSSGRKTWCVRSKRGFAKQRVTIGDAQFFSLSDAREKALTILAAAARNEANPYQSKQAMTFEALAEEYMRIHAKPKKRTWKEDQRKIDRELLPNFGRKKIAEIRRHDVLRYLDELVAERGQQININRIYETLRKMFSFAVDREYLENTPCYKIKKPVKERVRERYLTEDEIPKVWNAILKLKGSTRLLMMNYMLSGQRANEVKKTKRSAIDRVSGFWTIPKEFAKNGIEHRVPITPEMWLVFEKALETCRESEWAYPSSRLFRRNGQIADCPVNHIQKAIDKVRELSGVNFNGHDLRRTMATWISSQGASRMTIKKLLNHAEKSVTDAYDHYKQESEKRDALEKWTKFIWSQTDEHMSCLKASGSTGENDRKKGGS